MDRITEAFHSERYLVLFFEKITTVSTRPYGTRKYSLFSIIPPRWLTELVIHALKMKDKDDTQRRNYVYKTLWTKLRDKRQLPKGKLVYPAELVRAIREIFPKNIQAANVSVYCRYLQ